MDPGGAGTVNLYWLPLGAGGHCVRLNGRIFEAITAKAQHRKACDLYHSALEIQFGTDRYVIEMAPVWNERAKERGVVAEGSVGMRGAGRLRLFRYEIRRWRDGRIPDVDEAVDSPQRLSTDPERAARILELVPHVPTAVWGRDELKTGDMWNSNSLISWLIARSGIDTDDLLPPTGGRAPGWNAGLVAASAPLSRRPSHQRPTRSPDTPSPSYALGQTSALRSNPEAATCRSRQGDEVPGTGAARARRSIGRSSVAS